MSYKTEYCHESACFTRYKETGVICGDCIFKGKFDQRLIDKTRKISYAPRGKYRISSVQKEGKTNE